MEMRYYQKEAVEAIEKGLRKKKGTYSPMLVMATGTGKTFTTNCIFESTSPKKILWITHTEELIEQSGMAMLKNQDIIHSLNTSKYVHNNGGIMKTMREIEKNPLFHMMSTEAGFIQENLGVIKQDIFQPDKKLNIASIQTIHNRLDKLDPNLYDFIIIDEAHQSRAKTWNKVIDHFNTDMILGLTATPDRLDNLSLGTIYKDDIAYEYDISTAIQDEYLAEIDARRIKTSVDMTGVKTTGGDFNKKDLKRVNNPQRNQLMVNKIEEYAPDRQGVIFAVDVQHAQDITDTLRSHGRNAHFIVGDQELCPNRFELIQRFKAGEIQDLVNVDILTMGFDHDDIGYVVQGAPTKSVVKFLQRIGRGTRLKSDGFVEKFGQQVKLIDMVDITSRHRVVNTWTLDEGKKTNDKVFITKKEKKEQKEREERESKIDRQTQEDEKVDLLKLPKVKISKSPKMQEPATEKQLDLIAKFGYDVNNFSYTKADATIIISGQEASFRQKKALEKNGYDISKGVTYGEAKLAFEQIHERKAKEEEKKNREAMKNSPKTGKVFSPEQEKNGF